MTIKCHISSRFRSEILWVLKAANVEILLNRRTRQNSRVSRDLRNNSYRIWRPKEKPFGMFWSLLRRDQDPESPDAQLRRAEQQQEPKRDLETLRYYPFDEVEKSFSQS